MSDTTILTINSLLGFFGFTVIWGPSLFRYFKKRTKPQNHHQTCMYCIHGEEGDGHEHG